MGDVRAGPSWPSLPYEEWSATCDTLHAHAQTLGKLAVRLAPPEPQLQHAALRLSTRGWETAPLPAPDGSGALTVALDLHEHRVLVEHSNGQVSHVPLTPHRPVAEVTQEVLKETSRLVGPLRINQTPQEVPWDLPLDQDYVHATYDPEQVSRYFAAATRAALVLTAARAPYRGRCSPVNAWWGTFDLAVSLYSGRSADPPDRGFIRRNSGDAEQAEVGWWPGDARYPRAAFFAFASPAPDSLANGRLAPSAARWEASLGEYVLDWDDVVADADPYGAALQFARSAIDHVFTACDWDAGLAASARGIPPPVS